MTQFKGTSGPWKYHHAYESVVALNNNGSTRLIICGPPVPASDGPTFANDIFNNANAHLIAAAPELLGALEDIIWKLNRKERAQDGSIVWARIDINDATIRAAQAIIKKALNE